PAIDAWLRLRQARVTRDTAVAFRRPADLPAPAAREAGAARAQALLAAGDSVAALEAFAQAGRSFDLARLALAHGDSSRARDALYGLMARAPESDDAAAAVGVALAALRPRTPPERVALARAMKAHGAAADARLEVERALRQGDSSAATLVLAGELLTVAGRFRDAERAYRATTAPPPAHLPASLARLPRPAHAWRDGGRDSAAALFHAEVAAAGPQRTTGRFWLGRLTLLAHDTAGARATWLALVREDSIGYYGLRARREIDLPPLRIAAAPLPGPSPTVATSLGRIDTLLLAGLDTAAQAEVRAVLARAPQQAIDAPLALSDGLAARG